MRTLVAALLALAPLFGAAAMLEIRKAPAPACPAAVSNTGDYEVSVSRPTVQVPRGGVAEVVVCISRAPGFTAPIRLRAELLPDGVDAGTLQVPGHATSGKLRIVAERFAPPGIRRDAVLVAAGYGHVHTVGFTVVVSGARDRGPSDPNGDAGKTALAAALARRN